MPTYEYECGRCGHTFEQFQSMTARPIKTCPECRKRSVKRLIGTGAGLIFKGSGFYTTDYRSEGYKKAAKRDREGASSGKKKEGEGASGGKEKGSGGSKGSGSKSGAGSE